MRKQAVHCLSTEVAAEANAQAKARLSSLSISPNSIWKEPPHLVQPRLEYDLGAQALRAVLEYLLIVCKGGQGAGAGGHEEGHAMMMPSNDELPAHTTG